MPGYPSGSAAGHQGSDGEYYEAMRFAIEQIKPREPDGNLKTLMAQNNSVYSDHSDDELLNEYDKNQQDLIDLIAEINNAENTSKPKKLTKKN